MAGGSLKLTDELVALVERMEPDPGPEPGDTEHSDQEIHAMALEVLESEKPEELWIFAYGSLIWNPDFEHTASRRARASGWHRAFCMRLTRWRGTRELPGLMMALDRGGACTGIVFRLPDRDHAAQVARLLEREIDAKPPTNVPRWLTVETLDGPLRALAFVADRNGPAYAGPLFADDVATTLARAAGHWGSCAMYLQRTVRALADHGFHDRNLWRLQSLVAERIAADH